MPTTAELDRLAALLDRLEAIGDKDRGELIRSAEWNELVGAVTEVARAVLGEDRVDTVAPHVHADQVELAWLAPQLRQLLTGGPLSDSGQVARLGRVERDLTKLARSGDAISADVAGLRGRLADVSTNDLARAATVTSLGRRVEGIGDARDDVADVRRTLEVVQGDVQRAIAVGQQLEVNGEPLDVGALIGRLGGLEELRERLTRPDGSLLDATEFERQVNALETRLVTEDELTEALQTVQRPGLDQATIDDLVVRAAARAGESLDPRLAALGNDLRGEIGTRFADVDGVVSAAIAAAEPDITRAATERAEAVVAQAVSVAQASIRTELTSVLDARVTDLATTVDVRISGVESSVAGRVAAEVERILPGRLAGVDVRIADLEDRVETTEVVAGRADQRSAATQTRVEQVNRDAAAARAQLRTQLDLRIDDVSGRIETRIPVITGDIRERIGVDIRGELSGMRRSLESDLGNVAAEAARTEMRVLRGQLDGNVRAVITDEVAVGRDELLHAVEDRAASDDVRLRGIIAEEVRRATAGLEAMVTAAVEARLPDGG